MPLVSVVIPTYNAEKTILETIQSIHQQTFQDFELIISNDGSTDRTLEIVSHIDDPRVKIISEPNGGVSVARNRGIAIAKGEFLSFIDQDDLWTPDKLELQLTALQQHSDVGAAYSWTANMLDDGKSKLFGDGGSSTAEGNIYPQLLLGNFIGSGSNILVRRQVIDQIGGFDEAIPNFADWDFCLRIAAKYPFVLVPKYQILYRKTSGSMSSKVGAMAQDGLRAIEQFYQAAPPELQYLKNQSIALFYRYCADLALANTLDRDGLQFAQGKLWAAIKLYPKLLNERYAQKLIVKLLLQQLLPKKYSSFLVQFLRKQLSLKDLCL